ncbi:MAG: hypothetical protein ACKPH7_08155 [Planktothrix sp.]
MFDPDEIARKIAEYEQQMAQIQQWITELKYLPVVDAEGNLISYADWEG